jgi:type I restriction enzyme M protein
LTDLLDFSRKDFNKAFSLTPKKNLEIQTRWGLVKIEELCEVGRGRVINHNYIDENLGEYPVYSSQTQNDGIMGYINSYDFEGEYVTWTTDGVYAGTCFYRSGKFNCTNVCGTLKAKNDEQLLIKYLPLVLNLVTNNHVVKSANPKLMNNVMANIKIPLPPLNIQQEIVAACEVVDGAVRQAHEMVKSLNSQLADMFLNQQFSLDKLANVAFKVSDSIDPQQQIGTVNYIGLENIESQTGQLVGDISTEYQMIKSNKTCFIKDDVLYGKLRPNLNKVYLAKQDGICSTDILVFRFKNKDLAKFYNYYLRTESFNQAVLQTVSGQQLPRTSWGAMQDIKIPVPPLTEQADFVAKIEAIETKIAAAQRIIDQAPAQKQAVLRQYL